MNNKQQDLAKFIQQSLFKTLDNNNRIRLSSGKLSNYYFDIRSVSSSWYFSKLIAYAYEEIINENIKKKLSTENFGLVKVGGLETGAIPIIMSLVHEYQLDGFYVRKEPKKYGLKQQVEGVLSEYCFLVDDIVTSGKSILKCIDAIKRSNHHTKIIGVYPLIDRNRELENYDLFFQLRSRNIEYVPLFSSLDFINNKNNNNNKSSTTIKSNDPRQNIS